MERGTEAERAAVRERWAALERTERRARQLLVATGLLATGALLTLLGVGLRNEVCAPVVGAMESCRAAGAAPLHLNLLVLAGVTCGAAGLALGLWAVRDAEP